jgi:hypothetical protein
MMVDVFLLDTFPAEATDDMTDGRLDDDLKNADIWNVLCEQIFN